VWVEGYDRKSVAGKSSGSFINIISIKMDAMSMMDWKVVEPYPGSQASMDDMPVLEPISDVNPLSQSLTEMPELELAVMPVLEPISDVNPLSQSLTEMPTLELAVLPMEHEHPMEFAVESEDEVVPTLPTLASVISQTEVPMVIESEDEVVSTLPTLDSVISQTEVPLVIESEDEVVPTLPTLDSVIPQTEVPLVIESEDEVVPTLPTLDSVISQTEVTSVIESEDEVVPTLPTLDSVISQTEVTSVIESEGEGDYSMQGPKATAMFGFEYEYPDYDADAEERVKKGSKKSFKMTDIVVVPQIVFEDRTAIVNDKFSKKWTERIRLGKVLGVVIDPGCILQVCRVKYST